MGWFRGPATFLKNVWFFRRELWAYRPWDFAFAYRMLNRAVFGMKEVFESDVVHADMDLRVGEIENLLAWWERYEENGGMLDEWSNKYVTILELCEAEERAWGMYHEQLKNRGAWWWN